MAKFAEKNVLDYRLGGDTLSSFAQKYMAEIPRIYQFLNNLRTHDSNGTEQVEPEPYQIKVEDDKFYVRNKANDAWVYLFDAAKNGGMRSDSFGKQSAGGISSRPNTGNSTGDLFWDTDSGKVYMWLSDKWQLLLSLNITDLTGYDNILTKSNLTIPETGEVTSEPNKIPQTNENGVLPVNILGNAAKMAGINVEANNLRDGQVFTYRAASNSWRNEDKGVVGAGKSLVFTDNGTQLADYSGDVHVDLDIGATIDTHISTHNTAPDAHSAMKATVDDTLAPTADEDTVRNLLSELANMVKANKGTSTWRDTPSITLATLAGLVGNSAASHNAFYRGKDLTSYFESGEMSKAIAAGTFDDIYPGDYIIKSVTVNGTAYSDVKWIVGDLDYHLHRGDTETTAHHVVLYPETNLGTARMNATSTTVGGYQGSEMWTTTIPKYAAGIVNAFGSDHVLVHRERLTKAIDSNAYSGAGGVGNGVTAYADGEWTNVTVNLFNEAMMYGHAPFASSGRDTYDCNKQIAAFRYGQNFTRNSWCWLRDVASAVHFAFVNSNSEADFRGASIVLGVRLYFLLR